MLLLMLYRRLRALAARDGGGPAGQRARFLAGLRAGPPVSGVRLPPVVQAIQLIVLVVVVVTVPLSAPGTAADVTLGLAAVSWAAWIFAAGRPRLWLALLVFMGAAGGALAGMSSLSTAVAVGFVVTLSAGTRLPTGLSFAITAETVGAFLITATANGAAAETLIGWSAAFTGLWSFGITRRAFVQRAVDAEQALQQASRARAAETQAAALAERARIAREIHDVLAQALAAVSVNLQAAGGLLDVVPGKGDELRKAAECVERAGALTKEGMAEVRQAVLALRDDSGGVPADHADGRAAQPAAEAVAGDPLASRLRALADEHQAAGDAAVEFTIAGAPGPLRSEEALTVYRTAQEALTNARKHAPGQPVSVILTYPENDLTLLVSSPLPPPAVPGPLARAGAGYGLAGLRERAALAGGTLNAGPQDGRWQVRLRLPGGSGHQERGTGARR